MKRIVLFILLSSFYTIYCEAQTDIPFYEQTALDFYNSEILPRSNIDIKLKISDDLKSIHYIDAECLKNEKINEKNISSFRNSKASQGYKLNLKNLEKKRFKKVKKIKYYLNKENYVVISTAQEFNNRIFVIINEMAESNGRMFTLEFDLNGKIIDWCKSSDYVKIIFE
jgi:hypothetical protein